MTRPHCNEGFILNDRDNLCIPVPGIHLPGLTWGICLLWTLIIFGSSECLSRQGKERLTAREFRLQLLIGYSAI